MGSHFAVVASLALAILFSPETLVLGLVIAGDRKVPRAASLAFAAGAVIGIAFATGIGLWIALASGTEGADRHSGWPGFIVRVVIATALLVLGIYKAVNAFRGKPISDVTEPDYRPGKLRSALNSRFPTLMRRLDPAADLSASARIVRAGLAGFAVCGLHPKVFPIAIAAGHQIMQITDPGARAMAVAIFAAISVVPAVLPRRPRPGEPRCRRSDQTVLRAHHEGPWSPDHGGAATRCWNLRGLRGLARDAHPVGTRSRNR